MLDQQQCGRCWLKFARDVLRPDRMEKRLGWAAVMHRTRVSTFIVSKVSFSGIFFHRPVRMLFSPPTPVNQRRIRVEAACS